MLVGREGGQRVVGDLLAAARGGRSSVVVLVGEAGMGKTTLLDAAEASATGFLTLRSRAVETEVALPFGGLSELCRPVIDLIDHLDAGHADTLRGALGLSGAPVHSVPAVGAAVLALLASAAERCPLLLLVDDTHWLDEGSADALTFSLRRRRRDAVGCVLAGRPQDRRFIDAGLPHLSIDPLGPGDAEALLDRSVPDDLDATSRRSILEVAAGNPLALVELSRLQDPGSHLPGVPLPVGERLDREFAGRAADLGEGAWLALLTAAASRAGIRTVRFCRLP